MTPLGGYATTLFANAQHTGLSFWEAWQAALAFTFQIYFDFSGYSDMAVGLAYSMGLRLPYNFNSPYKSLGISEFWRRWHITLSRFLKYYLYFPLGGNRAGLYRTYINLLIVMLLGGLWHGASWTFILWGGLHGAVLAANYFWRQWRGAPEPSWAGRALSWSATFVFVVFAWVPFRAATLTTTFAMWRSMLDIRTATSGSLPSLEFLALVLATLLGCLLLPNSQQIVFGSTPGLIDAGRTSRWYPRFLESRLLVWRPRPAWGLAFGVLFAAALLWQWQMRTPPEFIYFNF